MTGRKKKGVTLGISGVLSLVAGVVLWLFDTTPAWLPIAVQSAGTILGYLGFNIVYPDYD